MTDTGFRIDPDPEMEASDIADASAFTTDDHTELNHTHFENTGDGVSVGTWECAPTREVIEAYPVHEMMTIVSGAITVTHKDGRAEHLGPGDTFFIAKGQYVVWEITERLRKIYMIME